MKPRLFFLECLSSKGSNYSEAVVCLVTRRSYFLKYFLIKNILK